MDPTIKITKRFKIIEKMKKINITLAIISLLFISCSDDNLFITGQGEIITQEIELEDFNSIAMSGSHEVIISKGAIQKIEVTGHSNIIERLNRSIQQDTWEITLKNGNYKNADLEIHIIIPETNNLYLSGSGSIIVNEFSSTNNVTISNSGSGQIELNKNSGCENLTISMDGSGSVYANNQFEDLQELDIDMDGSGNYFGAKNKTENCKIDISGSAQCDVFVYDFLSVKIAGSGEVNYKGNPTIETNISGSGKVNNFN